MSQTGEQILNAIQVLQDKIDTLAHLIDKVNSIEENIIDIQSYVFSINGEVRALKDTTESVSRSLQDGPKTKTKTITMDSSIFKDWLRTRFIQNPTALIEYCGLDLINKIREIDALQVSDTVKNGRKWVTFWRALDETADYYHQLMADYQNDRE